VWMAMKELCGMVDAYKHTNSEAGKRWHDGLV
jgi:hypothetical protein